MRYKMSGYIIHLWDQDSSAMDHYWVFSDWESAEAKLFYLLERIAPFVDREYYREYYSEEEHDCDFEDFLAAELSPKRDYAYEFIGARIVSATIHNNYARRP